MSYLYLEKTLCIFCFSYSGYEGLVEKLMLELPRGSVTYNQPVRCIHWNDNTGKKESPVVIECEAGRRITADHVIVTVPLGRIIL